MFSSINSPLVFSRYEITSFYSLTSPSSQIFCSWIFHSISEIFFSASVFALSLSSSYYISYYSFSFSYCFLSSFYSLISNVAFSLFFLLFISIKLESESIFYHSFFSKSKISSNSFYSIIFSLFFSLSSFSLFTLVLSISDIACYSYWSCKLDMLFLKDSIYASKSTYFYSFQVRSFSRAQERSIFTISSSQISLFNSSSCFINPSIQWSLSFIWIDIWAIYSYLFKSSFSKSCSATDMK